MRRKITFIISLILFQIFYLLSHYTVQYLNLFFLLTCLAALVVCYNLYRLLMQIFIGQKTEAELNLLKKQQALNAEHLQLVRQQENNLLQTQKQFTETLQTVQTLLRTDDCENAEKLIHDTLDTFQRDRFHPYCEDNLILAILESKRMLAEQSGIHVDYKIFLPDKSVIQPSDLSSVLFNILDNAIEACKLCEDKKHIWFKCVQESGKIILSVKNTYCEMNRKKKEGLHGIGLKNVEHVITSYGGNYSIKKIQGKFIVTILFWMEE